MNEKEMSQSDNPQTSSKEIIEKAEERWNYSVDKIWTRQVSDFVEYIIKLCNETNAKEIDRDYILLSDAIATGEEEAEAHNKLDKQMRDALQKSNDRNVNLLSMIEDLKHWKSNAKKTCLEMEKEIEEMRNWGIRELEKKYKANQKLELQIGIQERAMTGILKTTNKCQISRWEMLR